MPIGIFDKIKINKEKTKANKKIIEYKDLKTFLILVSIAFILPSVCYLIKNETILNFSEEFCFLLNDSDRIFQTSIYTILLLAFIILYWYIIKNREKVFNNMKQIYCFIITISLIFVFMVPFTSSDIFYYIGIGRLSQKYKQNPYYTDMKTFVDEQDIDIQNDTVMQKGYNGYWSRTTVIYGAVWTLICSILSFFSFGNVNIGLLIFKILNLLIHIGNCYLLYKISKKNVFPLLYGLNPFILLEGIANVHNDIYIIFFILLALYELLRKRKLVLALIFLAIATGIKYFPVLLLPLFIIYHYRDKEAKIRFIKCIKYGLLFVVFIILPYLVYARDLSVLDGALGQQNKITKGLYLFISQYFYKPSGLVQIMTRGLLICFSILYIYNSFKLLFSRKIVLFKEMRKLYYFVLAFIFLLITNFQPWYLMWITPFMLWQNKINIKLINQMQIMTTIANIVFLIYTESYIYGVPFFFIFVVGTLLFKLKNIKDDKLMMRKGMINYNEQ